jgi:hypothetical protein
MFSFYDNRLKTRLNNIKKKQEKNSAIVKDIFVETTQAFNYINWDEQKRQDRALKKNKSSMSNDKFNKLLDLEEREERIIKEIVERQN